MEVRWSTVAAEDLERIFQRIEKVVVSTGARAVFPLPAPTFHKTKRGAPEVTWATRQSHPSPASRLFLSIWEYAGEAILAALLSTLLLFFFTVGELHQALCKLRTDLLTGVGVALGLSAVVWVGTLAILASEFGSWLRKKGEASAYSRALATPVLVYVLLFMLVLVSACSEFFYTVVLIVFVLIYGLVNLVTMIRNVQGLVSLWQTWEQTRR